MQIYKCHCCSFSWVPNIISISYFIWTFQNDDDKKYKLDIFWYFEVSLWYNHTYNMLNKKVCIIMPLEGQINFRLSILAHLGLYGLQHNTTVKFFIECKLLFVLFMASARPC